MPGHVALQPAPATLGRMNRLPHTIAAIAVLALALSVIWTPWIAAVTLALVCAWLTARVMQRDRSARELLREPEGSQRSFDDVMSLVLSLSVACGIVGEVPLVLTFLAWIGIISPESLVRHWRLAVVLILIAAAVVTPGDYGITMLLIALPIAGLYVISIFLAYLVTRKRRAARAS